MDMAPAVLAYVDATGVLTKDMLIQSILISIPIALLTTLIWVKLWMETLERFAFFLIVMINTLLPVVCLLVGAKITMVGMEDPACTDISCSTFWWAIGLAVFAVLQLMWLCCIWSKISLTSQILMDVCSVVTDAPGSILVAYVMVLVMVAWSAPYPTTLATLPPPPPISTHDQHGLPTRPTPSTCCRRYAICGLAILQAQELFGAYAEEEEMSATGAGTAQFWLTALLMLMCVAAKPRPSRGPAPPREPTARLPRPCRSPKPRPSRRAARRVATRPPRRAPRGPPPPRRAPRRLFWGHETFRMISHVTTCGVVASWYFFPQRSRANMRGPRERRRSISQMISRARRGPSSPPPAAPWLRMLRFQPTGTFSRKARRAAGAPHRGSTPRRAQLRASSTPVLTPSTPVTAQPRDVRLAAPRVHVGLRLEYAALWASVPRLEASIGSLGCARLPPRLVTPAHLCPPTPPPVGQSPSVRSSSPSSTCSSTWCRRPSTRSRRRVTTRSSSACATAASLGGRALHPP